MRVGLLGCGDISRTYAAKLRGLPFLDLAACADLLPERAARLAERFEIPRALTPEQLIGDDAVELVVNLTVPRVHFELSLAAIEAGKHVFSEKPLALHLEQAEQLRKASEARGVRVGCAPDTFLGAGLQTCRHLIDEGRIGEPVSYAGFMMSMGPENWHPGPEIFYQRGAGPLFDMGPYYLTALVSLLGPAERISASARRTHAERTIGSEARRGEKIPVEVPTHVSSVIDLAGGPVATLVTSFDIKTSRLRNIEIHGTEGTLALPDPNTFGGPVRFRAARQKEWEEVPLVCGNAEQSRGIGLADLVRAIQEERPHRASLELSTHVLDLMESAIRSSEEGRHVRLSTTCERPAARPVGQPDDVLDG
ncbi:MAG: Gfo/Idh/MocA family oxidoreductase [Myxococcota bacterium]|nr:Gfo/Idh/MocA family oxidoreductase [Myxococcota bacterium]